MGKTVYFDNCLIEIRHCVYGRDNRKPIADAIEMAEKRGSQKDTKPIRDRFAERINDFVLTPLQEEGYYRLQLVRAKDH